MVLMSQRWDLTPSGTAMQCNSDEDFYPWHKSSYLACSCSCSCCCSCSITCSFYRLWDDHISYLSFCDLFLSQLFCLSISLALGLVSPLFHKTRYYSAAQYGKYILPSTYSQWMLLTTKIALIGCILLCYTVLLNRMVLHHENTRQLLHLISPLISSPFPSPLLPLPFKTEPGSIWNISWRDPLVRASEVKSWCHYTVSTGRFVIWSHWGRGEL